MKLTKILRKSKPASHNRQIILESLLPISILALLSLAIWKIGPYFVWDDYVPLKSIEKRIYAILFICLLWLLKFLLIDLDNPTRKDRDELLRKYLEQLHQRFHGALKFLKKTVITHHGHPMRLNKLPWYLILGPADAGKSALLSHAEVNFILQKQLPEAASTDTVEICDWWITRNATLVDVPGKYLSWPSLVEPPQKRAAFLPLWRNLLALIRKHRGKHGISGIILALPLPDILQKEDNKNLQAQLKHLSNYLYELKKTFPHTLSCQIVITKCDLIPGFMEFFAEAGNDEITQAWGVPLAVHQKNEKVEDVFVTRFDKLIRKLNQQLIWRLHQERNPLARPFIKDFPLQIEDLKLQILEFVKRCAGLVTVDGVYLTSSLQTPPIPETHTIEETAETEQNLQLLEQPPLPSRAYFIKQFVTHVFAVDKVDYVRPTSKIELWKTRFAYAFSIGIIAYAAIILVKNFELGMKQAYAVQSTISDYNVAIQKAPDLSNHLLQTTTLLDTLQESEKKAPYYKFDLHYLLTFYSNKAQEKKEKVYQLALENILLPEIKIYLEDYMRNPPNKNPDITYNVLKAYLMLGNPKYYQSHFLLETLRHILPNNLNDVASEHFLKHSTLALRHLWRPLPLNLENVQQTRQYFLSMPNFQLGYVLMRSMSGNNVLKQINLGMDKNGVFTSSLDTIQLPYMYIAKAFNNVISHDVLTAANEAASGNWILGTDAAQQKNPEAATTLIQQLRIAYVSNYVDAWESILASVQMQVPNNLADIDKLITVLTNNNSPLLQLLRTVHDNTYFEPVISASSKLQKFGNLMEKNKASEEQLYLIFASLQGVHQVIRGVIHADDTKKAAFGVVSNRMQTSQTMDAVTQLRLVAERSPEPLKTWLNNIANQTWHLLIHDASKYIDTSWQNTVVHPFQSQIANHYPFDADSKHDVELQKFVAFFGNPGTLVNFYTNYLAAFIDTSKPDWTWKSIDNHTLAFSDATLKQIQQAMQIHYVFFQNGDDKLSLQFALKPYKLDKKIKQVKLSINDKNFLASKKRTQQPQILTWPNASHVQKSSLQIALNAKKTLQKEINGEWALFKLFNQSFDKTITEKELLLTFTMDNHTAQYLLFSPHSFNPFLAKNLQSINLPESLTENA